jgi:hypothetical protein
VAREDYTPGHDVETEVFGDRDALNDPVGGELDDEDGNVDTGC